MNRFLASSAHLALTFSLALSVPASAQSPAKKTAADSRDLGLLLGGAVEDAAAESDSATAATITAAPTLRRDRLGDDAPHDLSARIRFDGQLEANLAAESPDGQTREIIRERYPNRRVKVEREVAQDEERNYRNHGSWKMWDPQGNLVAEGKYTDGQRNGTWRRWFRRQDAKLFSTFPYNKFDEPFVSEVHLSGGALEGEWAIFDAKQRKISSWLFAGGQRHGKSLWFYPNGERLREVEYDSGDLHGESLQWDGEGKLVSKANYQHGRRAGEKSDAYSDGFKRSQGMYLFSSVMMKTSDDWWNAQPATFTNQGEDERHGPWTTWYPNGQVHMKGGFEHDKPDGRFIWWHPNGQKAVEGSYQQGLQHGTWMWWHANGQKATEGQYVNGEQVGRWTVWNDDGKVTEAAEHSTGSPQVATPPKTPQGSRTARKEESPELVAPKGGFSR